MITVKRKVEIFSCRLVNGVYKYQINFCKIVIMINVMKFLLSDKTKEYVYLCLVKYILKRVDEVGKEKKKWLHNVYPWG